MMLIQFRLQKHEKAVEREILNEILRYLEQPRFRAILDSRDPSDISDAMREIAEKIVNEDPDFKEGGKNHIFRDDVPKLANELKLDILLLSFTYEYIQEFPEDIELSFDPAADRDALNDYIIQFEGYLEADKVTDVDTKNLSFESIQTAFGDASDARMLGIDNIKLGDLVIERLQAVQPQETQVQTAAYMPAGVTPVLKGFGGAKRKGQKYSYRRLRPGRR